MCLVNENTQRAGGQTCEEEIESNDYDEKGGEAIGIVGVEQAHDDGQ